MKSVVFLFSVFFAFAVNLQGEDGQSIHGWVKQVVETSLDYHCRAKFGDNAKTFTPNPDKLVDKWQRLDHVLNQASNLRTPNEWNRDSDDLNQELVGYFGRLRTWEHWLRESKEDYHRKMDYFLVRVTLEQVVGDEARKGYDLIPDDAEVKQDLKSIVSAGLNRELKNGEMQYRLEVARLGLIDRLSRLSDPNATGVADELRKLGNKPEYERQWLSDNRPGLLDRNFVTSRKSLYELKKSVESRMNEDKIRRIQECPSILCRQFMADYTLASQYENAGMPEIALPPAQRWVKSLDNAYKEALNWNGGGREPTKPGSAQIADSSALAPQLLEILLKTNRVYQPRYSSDGEPFDYVNPIDISTIQQQAELIKANGDDLGFVGVIDAVEKVLGVAAVNNELLVVQGKSGIATYDLKDGARKHLMYDLPPDTEVGAMAATKDGSQAYIVTDSLELLCYDLATGRRDSQFKAPEVPRKDARIAVSPDGKLIAIGVLGTIATVDSKSGKPVAEFRSRPNLLVYGLEFSSDSRTITLCGNGPNSYEYDVRNGDEKQVRRITADKRNNAYTYSVKASDGLLAASGRGALAVWPEGSDRPLFQDTFTGNRTNVMAQWGKVAPDKTHLLVSHGIWNIRTGENIVRFLPTWEENVMSMTEDGGRLVMALDKTVFVVPSCVEPVRTVEEPKPEYRTWSDKSGKFSIRAILLGTQSGKVALRKTDGSTVQVPLSVLSDGDRKYVETMDGI